MRLVKSLLVCALVMPLMACKNLTAQAAVSARIVEPTAQSRAELLSVVSEALGQADILLADDALVHDSQLIITRKQHKTIEDGLLQGRSYELPVHFDLVIHHGRCELIHRSSGDRWHLQQTKCVASP